MNDMKKKLDFKVLAILGVVVFSACDSDSDLFNPEKAAAKKEAQYASAFVQRYGEIAVDQDWGFGVTPTTRVANTNSNQWKDFSSYHSLFIHLTIRDYTPFRHILQPRIPSHTIQNCITY